MTATYLFHSESSDTHYWQRRPTTDTPPGPLPGVEASSAFDAINQLYQTDVDTKRALILGAHAGTGSIRVISPKTLELVDEYFIGISGIGNARHVAYDRVGDRYYLVQWTDPTGGSGPGGSSGDHVTVFSCAPDGSDVQSFHYLPDMVWNGSYGISGRNDGLPGISVMSVDGFGGDFTATISRMNPDGTRASTVDLPPASVMGTYVPALDGRNQALMRDGRLAVMMYDPVSVSDPSLIGDVAMGVLDGDTWTVVTHPADHSDPSTGDMIRVITSTLFGVTTYSALILGCLTPDPNGGLWFADRMLRLDSLGALTYFIYRWTETDGWTDRVGSWPGGDLAFVASLLTADRTPLRQVGRPHTTRQYPRGQVSPTRQVGQIP